MRHFFNKHEEWILGISGLVLAGIIISLTSWAVGRISDDLARALSSGRESQVKMDFNIEGIKGMNLGGLSESGL